MNNVKIIRVPVLFGYRWMNGKRSENIEEFDLSDILTIKSHTEKKGINYTRFPLFQTKVGDFAVAQFKTLESIEGCFEKYQIIRLDVTNIVNMNNILEFDSNNRTASMGYNIQAAVAGKYVSFVEEFLNKKE